MSDWHKRAKGRIELPSNNQEGSSKSAEDLNTQLFEGSRNTNTETPVIVKNAKDQIDINPKEQVIKAITDKTQSSTTHNPKGKTPTETSNPGTDPSDIEAQVAVLEKRRRKVYFQLKLKKLQEKEALSFPTLMDALLKEVADLTKNKQLALERAKCIRMPDVYKSESQKHLDWFLMQVNNMFKAQLTIYALDKDKCHFAGSLYDGTPRTNWRAMEKQISEDLDKVYKYDLFIKMLQDKLVSRKFVRSMWATAIWP